MVKAQVPN